MIWTSAVSVKRVSVLGPNPRNLPGLYRHYIGTENIRRLKVWRLGESNSRPSPCKGDALPTEPSPRRDLIVSPPVSSKSAPGNLRKSSKLELCRLSRRGWRITERTAGEKTSYKCNKKLARAHDAEYFENYDVSVFKPHPPATDYAFRLCRSSKKIVAK